MSDNVQATSSATASAPTSSNAITAGAVASSNGVGGESSSSTSFASLDEVKKKAPKVYDAMMQGVAMNICKEMEHHQDRLKKLWRDGSQPN